MKSKIYVHNLAHIQDARLIEHNKAELFRLLGPVLRRKKYKGLYQVVFSRQPDAIYQVAFQIQQMDARTTYPGLVFFAPRVEKVLIASFIRDMISAAKRIKSSWQTTFSLTTPEEVEAYFDDDEIKFKILQFVPHGT